jgi:hypothetical protein
MPDDNVAPGSLLPQPGLVSSEMIFDPAPVPQCHASTFAETPGALVAAWFGGTHESHSDVGIWVARRENGKWSVPVEVADGVVDAHARFPCWNPVLFQPPGGPLLLFYLVTPGSAAGRDPGPDQKQARSACQWRAAVSFQYRRFGTRLASAFRAHVGPGADLGNERAAQRRAHLRPDTAEHSHVSGRTPAAGVPQPSAGRGGALVPRQRPDVRSRCGTDANGWCITLPPRREHRSASQYPEMAKHGIRHLRWKTGRANTPTPPLFKLQMALFIFPIPGTAPISSTSFWIPHC